MDLFDDILTDAPTTRAKPGGRFAPKPKLKQQPPQKNVSASTTQKESEAKISQNESHDAVALSSSAEESTRSDHQSDINVDNGGNKELPIIGEGSFLDSNQSLEVIDNSLEVSLNAGFKSALGDSNTGVSETNVHSNFEFGEVGEVLSAEIELDPFSNVLPDFGTRNAEKFKPKIKPRPRVGSTPTTASASPGIPFSTENRSFAAVIPSHLDSMNAMTSEDVVHDGTIDLSSSFGTSAAETADFFSGLESHDEILNQVATATGKPDLSSFNVNGTEENFVLPGYDNKSSLEAQEADLNPDFPIDIAYDNQSMKSGTDPTSEIPSQEGLTNSVGSPTLADFLQQDSTGEKEDANQRKKSLKKHKRSSIAGVEDKGGKTSREPRKQAARKPAKNSLKETVEDYDDLDPPYVIDRDELEENDDEGEVDHSSKRKKASTKSKKKSVAKNGKASEKSKKGIDVLEKDNKELPKKFAHSSRRKKRFVDKALLDDEFLDHRTLPIRDIILLAEYKEKLAKKEAAAASKTSSTNQSDGDFFHDNDANNEEEFYGSDDGFRDQYNDQAREKITSNTPLYNSHSFMDKAPRGKWSAHDTEKFYEAVRQFGTDFYMIQQLFPDKTHRQVVLKYKKEERQNPLLLSDAMKNRSTDLSFYKLLIERQKQNSNKEEQDPNGDASDLMPGEAVEDPTLGINEEAATTLVEQDTIDVKDREDSMAEQSDDKQDEMDIWSHYQSDI